jgi:hypothetical protein
MNYELLLATLTFVSSWCSVPSYSRATLEESDQCRQEILTCLNLKAAMGVNGLVAAQRALLANKVLDCTNKQKLQPKK